MTLYQEISYSADVGDYAGVVVLALAGVAYVVLAPVYIAFYAMGWLLSKVIRNE